MKNTIEVKKENTVGVPDERKMALYDRVAQFLADELDTKVCHVKPATKVMDDGKKKKTGGYGLAFNLDGKLTTLEIVMKKTAVIDDYLVTDETTPN